MTSKKQFPSTQKVNFPEKEFQNDFIDKNLLETLNQKLKEVN